MLDAKEWLFNLISIVGCITGVLALLLHLRKYLTERPKLKFSIDPRSHSYFFKTSTFNCAEYTSEWSAVISLKIDNCSSYPISISAAYASNKLVKKPFPHCANFKFRAADIHINQTSTTSHSPSKSMELPFRIEPFATVFASIRLPFFDKFVENASLPVSVKLLLETPRKNYSYWAKICEYTNYHSLRMKGR